MRLRSKRRERLPSSRYHCMVVFAYYPLAETRVQRQAEALRSRGYEVDVIALRLSSEKAHEVVRGVNVYRLSVQRGPQNSFAARLKRYLNFFALAALKLVQLHRQKQYDVIQVHNLPDFLVFCAIWPKLVGARVILDIHDVMPEFFAARTGRSMNSWPVRIVILQEQLACRFADNVITVTEPWRQALIQRGVPADKVKVVMNVPDNHLFHRGVASHSNGYGGDHSTFRLIYHGVQAPRQGLDILLCAMAKARPQAPGLRLTLHGTGESHQELVRLTQKLDLSQYVDFSTEFLSVSKLPEFIAQADAGVVPYRRDIFTDGILPTKLMEYIAVGLPVIAARTPVIDTYFDDPMIQFFEPENVDDLADSIVTLYHNAARRKTLVRESSLFLEQYNWTAQSAGYVELIDHLTKRQG